MDSKGQGQLVHFIVILLFRFVGICSAVPYRGLSSSPLHPQVIKIHPGAMFCLTIPSTGHEETFAVHFLYSKQHTLLMDEPSQEFHRQLIMANRKGYIDQLIYFAECRSTCLIFLEKFIDIFNILEEIYRRKVIQIDRGILY